MKKIILFFALLISLPSFAQYKNDGSAPVVTLANISAPATTIDKVLSLPRLFVMSPINYSVKSFSISFISKETYGPFKSTGGTLTDAEIAILKKLQGSPVKIVVDDIKISFGSRPEMSAQAFSLTCDR